VWALVKLVGLPQDEEVGLLLVGMAAAGPLGIKAAQIAGANVGLALALVVLLEVSNSVFMPIWAAILMPEAVGIPLGGVLGTLAVAVFLPVGAGWALRTNVFVRTAGWAEAASKVSSVALVVAIGSIVARHWESVLDGLMAGVGWVALVTVVVSLIAGWVIAGPERATRLTVSLVTAVRANALALAVATTAYPDRPGVRTAIATFGVVSVMLSLGTAVVFRRLGRSPTKPSAAER
jgi:predicted Na+-dependent transporter